MEKDGSMVQNGQPRSNLEKPLVVKAAKPTCVCVCVFDHIKCVAITEVVERQRT